MPRPPVLTLRAPLTGRIVPLGEVPDPVFSSGMAGGGVAIAPTGGTAVAPCDGRVAHVHPAGHAVTLITPDGLEVLIHVGLATSHEHAARCTARTAPGADVRTGDTLLEIELPDTPTSGRSVLTALLVGPPSRVTSVTCESGLVTAGTDIVLRVEVTSGPDASEPLERRASPASVRANAVEIASPEIAVSDPSGLHARAAARVADAARHRGADVWVEHGGTRAEATSVIGLLALDVAAGDVVRVVAKGQHARSALDSVVKALGAPPPPGVEPSPVDAQPAHPDHDSAWEPAVLPADSTDPRQFIGACASPGTVMGPVIHVRRPTAARSGPDHPRARRERDRLVRAIARAATAVARARGQAQVSAGADAADVIGVHAAMLADPALRSAATTNLARGLRAAEAWTAAVEAHAARLEKLRNAGLASKADDLRDVGRRVLRELGAAESEPQEFPCGAIALSENLDVSDVLRLAHAGIAGIVTVGNSAISHAAVIAQGFGLPMVGGVDHRVLEVEDGTVVLLDATAGSVYAAPSEATAARAEARQRAATRNRVTWIAEARSAATTTDGRRVQVTGNVASSEDVQPLLDMGGEGVGLLRSEFLFLDRSEVPAEDEQAAIYGRMAAALGPDRHLVVRTFDAGGDKPLAFLPQADGQARRGLALTLAAADVFRVQLRAILQASTSGNVRVLFPLVTSVDDWRAACALLEEERRRLGLGPVSVGVSIEVPAVVTMLDTFAQDASFFAVGTNDLAASLRGPAVGTGSGGAGALDPAVLQVIAAVTTAAQRHRRAVSVCGLAAADPLVVPLLVGLDVNELSVAVPAIPEVKARVRGLTHETCRRLAREAIAASGPDEVRAFLATSALTADANRR